MIPFRHVFTAIALPLSMVFLAAAMPVCAQTEKGDEDLDSLISWLDGDFSSERHAQYDSSYYDIDLHMKRIWRERDDGAWFYVEQSMASKPQAPYRQRVYRVQRVEEGMFESIVYELPDPASVVGAWYDLTLLGELQPEDLRQKRGCEVYLQATGKSFVGSTHGTACRSALNGASYATSEVTIMPDRIISWDRGWSATDKQVWGAEQGGYHFFRE